MSQAAAQIVVVDDDDASRYLKSHILRNAGFKIFEAASGAEAIAAIELHEPEVVVLDVKLPDVSGLDICRRLKATGSPILILQTSATYVRGEDRALGLESGADSYLTEPIERDELIAAVRALLRTRKAENELRRLNETLEQRVAERTSELATANRQLIEEINARRKAEEKVVQSRKMEAIGQLTGGVAHDFNNLLAIMIFNIEALQRRLPKEMGDLRRLINSAMQAAQQAITLTRRLLAFSRRQPLEPKPVNINKLVADTAQLLRRSLGEHINIETDFARDLWHASADANELRSALLNLAVNARDAMQEGGRLLIVTANCSFDAASAEAQADLSPGDYVMIAFGDNGIGMSEDIVAKAFDPFFTTKEVGHGTGLGLSQVYGFVKQSGGHVRIDSEPGKGTTVHIYLPRLQGDETEMDNESEPQSIPDGVKGEMILVVEDDAAVRASSAEMLQELGYSILECADGPAALRLLDATPAIDLLFTDIGLPNGLNGRELAEEAQRRRPELKVLFTTGYTRDVILRQGRLEAGVNLLMKPVTFAQLAAKLRRVLDGKD
jgi:signal transduction histidine kinase